MKQKEEIRKKIFKSRMNDAEIRRLKELKAQSTERSLSNYARKVLLQKPVLIRYRNSSADDFLKEMIELKKELHAIGNDFDQAVHKLHLLGAIPEFRSWIKNYESLHYLVHDRIKVINLKLVQLYEQWLQK